MRITIFFSALHLLAAPIQLEFRFDSSGDHRKIIGEGVGVRSACRPGTDFMYPCLPHPSICEGCSFRPVPTHAWIRGEVRSENAPANPVVPYPKDIHATAAELTVTERAPMLYLPRTRANATEATGLLWGARH